MKAKDRPSTNIRLATLADIDRVVDTLNQALDKKLSYKDAAWGNSLFTKEEMMHDIEANNAYLALNGDVIVGIAVLQSSDENMWGIDGLDKSALYMHKLASLQAGVGLVILGFASDLASKSGKSFLRLDCSYQNKALLRYYTDYGFREVRRSHSSLLQKDI